MTALRFGVVGIGYIVKTTMAPAMLAEPECELVAGVSRDQARAEAFAEEFGVPYVYTDYDEMLANPDVDAVFIATPNAFHYEQVLAAARAGKQVFCDKPMSLTIPDAIEEVEVCAAAGVRFGINFHNRHLPWVQESARIVEAGDIGDVITVQVEASAGLKPPGGDWRGDPALAGWGTLSNVGVHVLDFLRVILHAEPVEVMGLLGDGHGRYAVDTEVLALITFSNGAHAYVNVNQNTPYPQNDIAIYGTKGRILGTNLTRSRIDGDLEVTTAEVTTSTPFPSPGAHRRSLAAYAHAVLRGEEPNASGLDGLRSIELCAAIATSSREKRTVPVEYSRPQLGATV